MAVSIEMMFKGLLIFMVVSCMQTEQTGVVQLCILMPLSFKIKAMEERHTAKTTLFFALISVHEQMDDPLL